MKYYMLVIVIISGYSKCTTDMQTKVTLFFEI